MTSKLDPKIKTLCSIWSRVDGPMNEAVSCLRKFRTQFKELHIPLTDVFHFTDDARFMETIMNLRGAITRAQVARVRAAAEFDGRRRKAPKELEEYKKKLDELLEESRKKGSSGGARLQETEREYRERQRSLLKKIEEQRSVLSGLKVEKERLERTGLEEQAVHKEAMAKYLAENNALKIKRANLEKEKQDLLRAQTAQTTFTAKSTTPPSFRSSFWAGVTKKKVIIGSAILVAMIIGARSLMGGSATPKKPPVVGQVSTTPKPQDVPAVVSPKPLPVEPSSSVLPKPTPVEPPPVVKDAGQIKAQESQTQVPQTIKMVKKDFFVFYGPATLWGAVKNGEGIRKIDKLESAEVVQIEVPENQADLDVNEKWTQVVTAKGRKGYLRTNQLSLEKPPEPVAPNIQDAPQGNQASAPLTLKQLETLYTDLSSPTSRRPKPFIPQGTQRSSSPPPAPPPRPVAPPRPQTQTSYYSPEGGYEEQMPSSQPQARRPISVPNDPISQTVIGVGQLAVDVLFTPITILTGKKAPKIVETPRP